MPAHQPAEGPRHVRAVRRSRVGMATLVAVVGCALLAAGCYEAVVRSQPVASREVPKARPSNGPTTHAVRSSTMPGCPTTHARGDRWLGVLTALDHRRARAWRLGSVAMLASVYAPASNALAADRAKLRGYLDRGLRVSGVHMCWSHPVLGWRARGEVGLRVVDELLPAVVYDGPGRRVRLPRDRPTRHVVVLVRVGGRWRIAWIRSR